MNSGPKVSVIMGIYNCERTLVDMNRYHKKRVMNQKEGLVKHE